MSPRQHKSFGHRLQKKGNEETAKNSVEWLQWNWTIKSEKLYNMKEHFGKELENLIF